jgi:hypothetical protein
LLERGFLTLELLLALLAGSELELETLLAVLSALDSSLASSALDAALLADSLDAALVVLEAALP